MPLAEPGSFLLIVAVVLLLGIVILGLIFARGIFLQHWMSSIIAGLFIIGIVPVANEFYWRRQKEFERCVQDRDRRYDLLGSTARSYTAIFKVHSELHYTREKLAHHDVMLHRTATLKAERQQPDSGTRLQLLLARESELLKERIRLEAQLAADSALMNRYLPDSARKYNEVALRYDSQITPETTFRPTREHRLVKDVEALIQAMEKEARSRECQ